MRAGVTRLRQPGAVEALAERGVPDVWRASISEAIAVTDVLDSQLLPIDTELTRLAGGDERAVLLRTIPKVEWLLGLTVAAEIDEFARFPSAGKLVGYSGLVPRVRRSGESSADRTAGQVRSRLLRWAAVEAAQQAWRPQKPWQRLHVDVRKRHGHGSAAKSAVAGQDPDRGLARLVSATAAQACRLVCGVDRPGKLRPAPGRLTARLRTEKPAQLPPDTMRRPSADRGIEPYLVFSWTHGAAPRRHALTHPAHPPRRSIRSAPPSPLDTAAR